RASPVVPPSTDCSNHWTGLGPCDGFVVQIPQIERGFEGFGVRPKKSVLAPGGCHRFPEVLAFTRAGRRFAAQAKKRLAGAESRSRLPARHGFCGTRTAHGSSPRRERALRPEDQGTPLVALTM